MMETVFQTYIEQIRKIIPSPINHVEVHEGGDDFLVFEVNSEWMFRFPRNLTSQQAFEKEIQFLSMFNSMSPLQIPDYRYHGDGFAGYLKVPGTPLSIELFQTFSESSREKLAAQFGSFLSILHNFPVKDATGIGITRGWEGNHHKNGAVFLEKVTPLLSPSVRKKTIRCMESLLAEKFDSKVIHGDFYIPDHVFYDKDEQKLGVIDFADVTIYDPAHDLQCIVEIGGNAFFETVMKHYKTDNDAGLLKRSRMRLLARPLFVAGYFFANGYENEYASSFARIEEVFSKA